jgi:hypothetical protein
MASRALGAFLALAAAAAIVVSIASSAWWAGTPVVGGKPLDAKYVHSGPLGATGCNVGGDGSCEAIKVVQQTEIVGYAVLAASGLAVLFLFLLLSAALRVSDHRRGIATTSLLFSLLAGGGGGALLALGPGIENAQVIDVPIGWGTFVFGSGVLASLLASLITRSLEREPLRLKPSLRRLPQADPPNLQPVSGVIGGSAPKPLPQHEPAAMARVAMPGQMPRLGPNTPAIGGVDGSPRIRAHVEGRDSPVRIRPPVDVIRPPVEESESPPRIRPSIDDAFASVRAPSDEPVNPFAVTRPDNERSPVGLPGMPPPSSIPPTPARSPLGTPPRSHSPSSQPFQTPLARSRNPSTPPSGPRTNPPSSPPPSTGPLARPAIASSALPGVPRSSAPSTPPQAIGSSPRMKAPTDPPRAPGVIDPVAGGASPRATAPTDAPRATAPTDAPRATAPTDPPRAKAPSVPPSRPVVPIPSSAATAPKGKSIVVPEHLRPATEQGVPVVGAGAAARTSQPALSPPPTSSRTLAHAIPPMPGLDGESRRGPTETDGRLEDAMRPTEHVTAQADAEEELLMADRGGVPHRAASDVQTGASSVGDSTAVGLEAAPPPPPILPGDDREFNRAGSQSEHTAPNQRIDELKASRISKTSIPISDRQQQPKPPIPQLDAKERAATNPPLSTAPSSLPPPKQLDSAPSGPTPACPQCESPMAWVEEHLRFYCRSCRMYF